MPKIKNIVCSIKKVPLNHPFITALHQVNESQCIQVKVELSDGKYGVGAATPNEKVTGDTLFGVKDVVDIVIKPELIGKSIENWNELLDILKNRVIHNKPAKATAEIALYNVRATITNQSLVNLLSAATKPIYTDYTISIEMINEAKDLVDKGFRSLKVKLGNNDIDHDIHTIKKLLKLLDLKFHCVFIVTRLGVLKNL